jgi:hypothetical protein
MVDERRCERQEVRTPRNIDSSSDECGKETQDDAQCGQRQALER